MIMWSSGQRQQSAKLLIVSSNLTMITLLYKKYEYKKLKRLYNQKETGI